MKKFIVPGIIIFGIMMTASLNLSDDNDVEVIEETISERFKTSIDLYKAPFKEQSIYDEYGFYKNIPASYEKDNEQFIRIVLPIIVQSNKEILKERQFIIEKFDSEKEFTRLEIEKIVELCKKYKVDYKSLTFAAAKKELLVKVDTIPIYMALAQASLESEWGTSRFVRKGNALFGQRGNKDNGIKSLRKEDEYYRKFDTLRLSVQSYMDNINVSTSYENLRYKREYFRGMYWGNNGATMSFKLVDELYLYAEDPKYREKLQWIMNHVSVGDYVNMDAYEHEIDEYEAMLLPNGKYGKYNKGIK